MARNMFFAGLLMLCACSSPDVSEYERISGKDNVDIHINALVCDTIAVDAGKTSYSGHWAMVDSVVYFMDGELAAIRMFPAKGEDCAISSSVVSYTFDSSDSTLFLFDKKGCLSKYNMNSNQCYCSKGSWYSALSNTDSNEMANLLENPDPEKAAMYVHNQNCDKLYSHGNQAILPVTALHPDYDGNCIENNAKDYWRHSYILLSCDLNNIAGTARLLGHYPPVYHKGIFPVFSSYDYIVTGSDIIISFAADSRIYVLDKDGHPVRAFGHAGENVAGNYPQTNDFAEYERNLAGHRKQYGYYGRLFKDGDFLFRTYHTDNDEWRLQIYNNEVLWGDVNVGYPLKIFGEYKGSYYAYAYTDYDNEQFKLVKFKLETIH